MIEIRKMKKYKKERDEEAAEKKVVALKEKKDKNDCEWIWRFWFFFQWNLKCYFSFINIGKKNKKTPHSRWEFFLFLYVRSLTL